MAVAIPVGLTMTIACDFSRTTINGNLDAMHAFVDAMRNAFVQNEKDLQAIHEKRGGPRLYEWNLVLTHYPRLSILFALDLPDRTQLCHVRDEAGDIVDSINTRLCETHLTPDDDEDVDVRVTFEKRPVTSVQTPLSE